MKELTIAENLGRLRHSRKITQEQLAEFIGVTKASVSKWETGQSMPDIVLLPRLAAFYDVTVDELLGYKPQLAKEQIQKLYQDFAADFAERPFAEVMEKTRAYVKRYYACYPFLLQMAVLWLNHFMLAGEAGETAQEKSSQKEAILRSVSSLCGHIRQNCREAGICNDAIVIQAMAHLQLGRAQEVVEALEDLSRPDRLVNQSAAVLIQAYRLLGDRDRAESFTQISMYNSILSLLASAVQYLSIHADNLAVCEETISRIERVIDAYALDRLHPNNTALFEYQAAICYAVHGEKKKALTHAGNYVQCIRELFSGEQIFLQGDAYFNRIEEWFDQLPGNGSHAPRSRKVVLEDAGRFFDNPVFAVLEDEPEYEQIKNKLKEIQ